MKIVRVVAGLVVLSFGLLTLYCGLKETGSKETGLSKSAIEEDVKKSQAQFLVYQHPARGIKIKYPQSWEKEEPTGGPILVKFSTLKGVININALIEDLQRPMTLDEYSALNLRQIKESMPANNMQLGSIEEGAATLANIPARKSVYTFTMKDLAGKGMQVVALKNNKAYILTYTATQDLYDNYLGIIQQMLNSFEIP